MPNKPAMNNVTKRVKYGELKEASYHKSAKTHAGNVFLSLAGCEKLYARKNRPSAAASAAKK